MDQYCFNNLKGETFMDKKLCFSGFDLSTKVYICEFFQNWPSAKVYVREIFQDWLSSKIHV